MLRRSWAVLALLMVIAPAHGEDVHVAVAANFLSTLQTLAQHFERQSGDRVLISSGSTGKLYAQIRQGAPFQVFLAADRERPRLLEQQGFAVAGSRFTYALGKLVLWSRDPSALRAGPSALRQGGIRRLAIANPKTAPYGRAARQTLTAMGLWQEWKDRLVRGENVGQTMQFAVTGNVDAAFVAYAQVPGIDGTTSGSVWLVPASHYQPIEQQAVLLRAGAENAAARRFIRYLHSKAATTLIEHSGYGVPES